MKCQQRYKILFFISHKYKDRFSHLKKKKKGRVIYLYFNHIKRIKKINIEENRWLKYAEFLLFQILFP